MILRRPSQGRFFYAYNNNSNLYICMTMTTESNKLFQDSKTGKLVEMLGTHDVIYAKVKDASGIIKYVTLEQLIPYDAQKGRLAKIPDVIAKATKEENAPVQVVPLEDSRLNMNNATAEIIQKRLPGVGYTTAKRIVELRMSLSGERFSNLKQLENIPRVNWDQLIEEDRIFIG